MGTRSSRTSSAEHAEHPASVAAGTLPARPIVRAPKRHASAPALSAATAQRETSDRDMRRKRPPAISFLLRVETARRVARVLSLLALDFAGLTLAIFTALLLKAAVLGHVDATQAYEETKQILAFAYLVTALLFARSGLYAGRGQRPGLTRIVASLFQVTFVALLFALVSGQHFSSFYIFWGSLAFALLYVPSLRSVYERGTGALMRAAGRQRRAVLVGTGTHIREVAHALADAPQSRIDVVGFLSLRALPANGLRALGSLADLERILDDERVDEVIIADPSFPQGEAVGLVDRCHRRGVRVRIAPSTMEILIHRAEFVPGESVPLFELKPPVFEGIDFALKRTFDAIGATLLLIALSPLLLAIWIAVRATSRGPALFHSMRQGIGERPFACLKFRTMYLDAEHRQADLEGLNEASGALFKIRDDPRTTPIGRLLRRFSLDELPQLVNVLRGEMSLVGPRPLPERDFEQLDEWHRKRYLVLPGITGLWQVSGRSELDFDDLVHLDFIYLEHWSLALDLTILLKTIPAVLSRRGAY
ncbi:MAG TPA: sugar transferase [Solirubrobacteraceae bacterium]|jgi:exopolysaccharide biosynthesis polyprenyl glycosylphosphotransferase|nr:sugar transferase [Solirubrobacteraceae bacterium]